MIDSWSLFASASRSRLQALILPDDLPDKPAQRTATSPGLHWAILKRCQVDLFSRPAALLAVALVAALWLARELPLAPALILCLLAAAPYSVSFWFGLVLSRRQVTVRSLGWVALAWAVALCWWTVFVNILTDHNILGFVSHDPSLGKTALFFLWHLVDLIPLLDIEQTLPWDEPLTYKSKLVGSCVLAYQLTVVLPVIALVRRAFKGAPTDAESDPR